jgi:hypothetical protein
MFSHRDLDDDVAAVRDRHAPGSPVLDVDADFETLPPAAAEDLGLFVDELAPASSPADWLPADGPAVLERYAGPAFTVGLPGAGTVVRTTQTDPPAVLVKRRAEGTPDDFLAFLIADRLVAIGAEPVSRAVAASDEPADGLPETFLPFFGPLYRDLDDAVRRSGSPESDAGPSTGLGPNDTFQVATALFDAWVGLHTRDVFASWDGEFPRLFDAWMDAGERVEGRLPDLPAEVARGETAFPSATEYACSAVRHGLDLPAPFAALDTAAYRDRGAPYAVKWAEKTFSAAITTE